MSFRIVVAVKEGVPVVSADPETPDGTYTVTGHDDQSNRNVSVMWQGPDGRFLTSASNSHSKERQ